MRSLLGLTALHYYPRSQTRYCPFKRAIHDRIGAAMEAAVVHIRIQARVGRIRSDRLLNDLGTAMSLRLKELGIAKPSRP